MGVKLGYNQYGKAENRVVRVFRDSDPHEIVDYNVSVALRRAGGPAPHRRQRTNVADRHTEEHRVRLRGGK